MSALLGQFTVETKNAGVGTLLIRVHGLKDTFKIEAHPFSNKDPRTLTVSYNPKVTSNYVVFVRWSGVHIPGSPFNITIRAKPGNCIYINICVDIIIYNNYNYIIIKLYLCPVAHNRCTVAR